MIRLSDVLIDFQPVDIKALEERNGSMPDDMRNSIVLYNKALENLRTNSEDIAIIELKKAISINPHFHEAMNLLGLCYGYIKEQEKAAEMFKRVVAAENNSVKALEYMKMLEGGQGSSFNSKPAPKSQRRSPGAVRTNPAVEDKMKSGSASPVKITTKGVLANDYMKYGVGLVAGVLLLLLIQLPFTLGKKDQPVTKDIDTPAPTTAAVAEEIEEKYNKLNEEYQKLQKEYQQASTELGYFKGISRLSEVERLSSARSYEEGADLLVLLRSVQFQGPEKERYDKLDKEFLPKATWEVFQDGRNLFYNQNYKDAIVKMTKVLNYGGEWEYMPDAQFFLAESYAGINDKTKALENYKKFKEKYPNHWRINEIDQKIAQLSK